MPWCASWLCVAYVVALCRWFVQIGGQTSPQSSVRSSYRPPMIHAFPGIVPFSTNGTDYVDIDTSDCGPFGSPVQVGYGPQENRTKYEATECTVTTPHERIRCRLAEGVGFDLRFTVRVVCGSNVVYRFYAAWCSCPHTFSDVVGV